MDLKISDASKAGINASRQDSFVIEGWVKAVARYADGTIKWVEEGKNIVVDTGIDYIFNNDLAASSLFIGLLGAGTPASGWTMTQAGASTGAPSDADADREVHAEYSEGTRQAWTVIDSTAKSVTNAASPAVFTFTGTISVTGAFLSTVSTKNNATGTLIAAKNFTSAKAMDSGETLEITYAINGSSSP